MIQTDAKTWLWSSLITNEKIEFQLLLNDEVWARGDTHVLEPGASIELTPDFEWPDIPRTSSIPAKSGSQTCIGRAQPTRGRRFARGPFRSATR